MSFYRHILKKGILGVLILSLFQWACASGEKVIREGSKEKKPSWIANTLKDDSRLYFVGICSNAETLEMGQQEAYKDALEKVSSYLGVKIESDYFSSISEVNRDIEQKIKARSTSVVQGAKIEDSYYEKLTTNVNKKNRERYDYYVLVSFSKSAAAQEMKRQEKEKKAKVRMAYDSLLKGRKSEASRDYYKARDLYSQGFDLVKDIDDVFELDVADIHNNRELKLRLESALEETNVKLSSISLAVKVKGLPDGSDLFNSNMSSVLYEHGFTISKGDAPIVIMGSVSVTDGGKAMDGYAYVSYATGSLSAKRVSDGRIMSVYPFKVKGFHREKKMSIKAAIENAGSDAGKALAEAIMAINGVPDEDS